MALDLKIFYFLNNFAGQFKIFDAFAIFFAEYFGYFLIAFFLFFLYFSKRAKLEKLRLFWTTAVSIIVSRYAITEIIRFFYHRLRPFAAYQVNQLVSDSNWSFPSGHAAFFFAMAAAIYLYNKKWGVGFFIAAILISASRVIAGVHYPSDILGGMIIGMLSAYTVFHLVKKRFLFYNFSVCLTYDQRLHNSKTDSPSSRSRRDGPC